MKRIRSEDQADLFGMPADHPARLPLSPTTNAVEKPEVPTGSAADRDMTPYFVRRLAGPLQVAALVVGRVPGPRLGDDAPLAARCEAFRARLVAFRESLRDSVPPRAIERIADRRRPR
jgi:hypothetical protein